MIDKDLFKKIFDDHQKYYLAREVIVRESRKVLKLSKQAIFSLHRDDSKSAADSLEAGEDLLRKLNTEFDSKDFLRPEGSYREAVEEYLEARFFYNFLESGKVEIKSEFEFGFMEYFGSISDLTGEILRKAVQKATEQDYDSIHKYKETMEEIMQELIKFDIAGKNRGKFDAAKRNLRRMEEIIYETSLKK